MKRLAMVFLLALGVALLLPSSPMLADGGRGGHGGGHGGRGGHGGGVVVIGGGWGWGWGWGWPGWYGYPGYYPGGSGYYGPRSRWAVIDTDISPEEALVYLDGRYIGTADDFDGYPDYLYLGPGHYRIEFRLQGFQTLVKEVDAQSGVYLDFKDKLPKVSGAKQYGSYETPTLEGPVRRYFAKRRGGNVAVDPSQPPEPSTYVGGENPPPGDGTPPQAAPPRESPRDRYGEQWRGSRGDRRQTGTRLRLTVEPADAAVYVDNRFVGTAEEVNSLARGVSVTPGRHTVTVSRPGFREKTSDVTVEEGETATLEIDLNR